MQTIELDGIGEVKLQATMLTLVIYEQSFDGGDIIADVFGKHKAEDEGDEYVVNFTTDNWLAISRALWAMCETEWQLRNDRGDATPNERPKPYRQWVRSIGQVNMSQISAAVVSEMWDGFFHSGAAASE